MTRRPFLQAHPDQREDRTTQIWQSVVRPSVHRAPGVLHVLSPALFTRYASSAATSIRRLQWRYATPLPPDSARRDFMAVGLAIALLLLLGFMVAVAPGPW